MWLLLYVLSCSARLQGVLSDDCSEFSCNFEVVVGGGEQRIYLLLHPKWKPRIAFRFRRQKEIDCLKAIALMHFFKFLCK